MIPMNGGNGLDKRRNSEGVTPSGRVSRLRHIKSPHEDRLTRKLNFPIAKIEFPQRNEVVTSRAYTIIINAPADMGQAEISIDRGPWQPCQYERERWRYDWSGYNSGEHSVVARIPMEGGAVCTTWPHRFHVRME